MMNLAVSKMRSCFSETVCTLPKQKLDFHVLNMFSIRQRNP